MNRVGRLWKYQQLELKEIEVKRQLKDRKGYNNLIKSRRGIEQRQNQLKRTNEKYQKDLKSLKYKEEEISMLKEKLNQSEAKVYNGIIEKSKELMAEQKKQQEIKVKIDEIENDILITMDSIDKQRAFILSEQKELNELKKVWMTDRNDYQLNNNRLEHESQQRNREKIEFAAQIDADDMQTYIKLKARFNDPVAQLKNDICTGCYLTISLNCKKHMADTDRLNICNNCGRLIFEE